MFWLGVTLVTAAVALAIAVILRLEYQLRRLRLIHQGLLSDVYYLHQGERTLYAQRDHHGAVHLRFVGLTADSTGEPEY